MDILEGEEWRDTAERRKVATRDRLVAGILLLFERRSKVRECELVDLDEETWREFEQAALPEMSSFVFSQKSTHVTHTPSAVLADAMGHVWLTTEGGTLSAMQLVAEIVKRIGQQYEIETVDRRGRNRDSLGLDVVG